MDAFESVVAAILERDGFWVRTSFKVRLSKEEKREIGRPSSPRWEIDVLAYRPGDNLLRVIECKSYLDSRGVTKGGFAADHKRLKLFNDRTLREVVLRSLEAQLIHDKMIRKRPKIQLCLAAGKIVASEQVWIQSHFQEHGWKLFTPSWIHDQLEILAADGYENTVAAVTAKMLLRAHAP